jgi:hypothetical protein
MCCTARLFTAIVFPNEHGGGDDASDVDVVASGKEVVPSVPSRDNGRELAETNECILVDDLASVAAANMIE